MLTRKVNGITNIPKYEMYGSELKKAKGQAQILNAEFEKTSKELSKWDSKLVRNTTQIAKLREKQSEMTGEVKKYKSQIEAIKLQKQQAQVDSIKNNFEGVSKTVGKAIGRVAKLALGVISVATAFSIVSQASSTLGQYDEQYATNLEYIRYLIAQAIAPALKYVVNLASTLLSYLNYILNAWFGITLFSKNSAKNFMKAKNSTGGISKNTGKIKKDLQTTSFDEMSVLSDTSSSGTSKGGAVAPSIDPSTLQGEVPEWLKWIADNKDLVIGALTGIAIAIGLIKLSDLIGGLEKLGPLLEPIKTFLKEHGKTIVGISLMIAGIVYTIESLLDYLKDPSWENFGKIIQGIAIFVIGLGLAFLGLPVVVAGVILLILGTIIKYWDKIKAFLNKIIDWLKSQIDNVYDKFGNIIGGIYTFLVGAVEDGVRSFDGLLKGLKNILDGMIKLVTGVFKGDWKMAWEGIKQIFKGLFQSLWSIAKLPLNLIISGLNALIRGANRIHFNVPDWVPGLGGKQFGFNIPQIPKLAKGTILNAPGRGVPVAGGTALAGEAGREAYLPLSDTQLLEELGSTIGKYITINANITNTMNGRVISRQLQQIRNDREFAYNG